jgi:drug/metabolite transporter (DMT)-like permease
VNAASLGLVLLAGLIHASWNIAAKKAGGDVRFATFSSILVTLIWGPLGLWLGWHVVPTWGLLEWGLVTASGAVHVLYYIALLRGYRKSDLTVVYPLARGSGPLLTSLVAIVFLGEHLTLLGAVGIAGVVAGVFFIAGGRGMLRAAHDPARHAAIKSGIKYGLLTGVFIAAYSVVDGYAVKFVAMSPILLDYFGNLVRVALLLPAIVRDRATARAHWRAQWKYALLVAAVSPLAYVLVLFALTRAPVSLVAPVRESSVVIGALLGARVLGEGHGRRRIVAATAIALGIAALAVS